MISISLEECSFEWEVKILGVLKRALDNGAEMFFFPSKDLRELQVDGQDLRGAGWRTCASNQWELKEIKKVVWNHTDVHVAPNQGLVG